MTQAARRDGPVTSDEVVNTALQLIEDNDVTALTMRRLAADLGVAVTSIYWHVGNRDALLDLLVERLLADMGEVRPSGRTARTRITSVLRQWRERLWERPHLIAVAHERGQTAAMFQPLQSALAAELRSVGLEGRVAAQAIRALQVHVVSSVVMERAAERGPVTNPTDPSVWAGSTQDEELVAALAEPLDYNAVFDLGTDALLDRLLQLS
jgi:TetR/AcrR family transcriptional regulator, tetracycline repressor protein